jgi:hypothetical protein
LIAAHVLLGLSGQIGSFPKLFGLLALGASLVYVIVKRDANHEAFLCAGYLVSLEVFLRMTNGVYLYEYIKYSVIVVLALGMIVKERSEPISFGYLVYMLLLLLGIVNSSNPNGDPIRKQIAFNLSGPIVLGISAMYFNNKKISKKRLLDILFYILLPVFAMVTHLFVKTPDIKDIVFGGAANFEMSGGFGPNQVSTALGFGIFIIGVLMFSNKQITGFRIIDFMILLYFIYRAIMTFSRGGILAALLCYSCFLFFMLLDKKNFILNLFKYLIIGFSVFVAIWVYTSNVTDGMVDNRFTGKNAKGVQKADATSGRLDIIDEQLASFYEAPLFGIGVGNGKYKRQNGHLGVTAASHNEMTRLIEEHGLIGVILLSTLLLVPLFRAYKSSFAQKGFLISFWLFWILTINHTAMRVAFPGFVYGLSLINIDFSNEEAEFTS